MNDSFFKRQAETFEKSVRDASDERKIESLEVILLNQLVKIHSEA